VFNEFYGFMGREAHQYNPGLFRGTAPIEASEEDKNYHLTTDLVEKSLAWMNRQQAAAPDKLFFVYWAPGATHAPHHVAPKWVKPFEGKFDQGWDKLREESFERQRKLGVIPADAKLTPRHQSIPAWNTFDDKQKKIASQQMEVYAGFMAHTDNGPHTNTWPNAAMTPFRNEKNSNWECAYRYPQCYVGRARSNREPSRTRWSVTSTGSRRWPPSEATLTNQLDCVATDSSELISSFP
jgi:arylsulfatase A-like enzyme